MQTPPGVSGWRVAPCGMQRERRDTPAIIEPLEARIAPAGAVFDLDSLDGTNGFQLTIGAGARVTDATGAGDVNGDGFADVLLHVWTPSGVAGTGVAVVFGKASGFTPAMPLAALDGFRISTPGGLSVSSFAAAGDVNGDGFDDVIVGTYQAAPHGANSGAAYVVFGKAGGFAPVLDLAALDGTNGFRLHGEAAGDFAGDHVAGDGDVNGDGFDDIVIAAPLAKPHGSQAGAAYVVFGNANLPATLELSSLDGTNGVRLNGAAGDTAGGLLDAGGDVNGDGFDDVIVGTGWPGGFHSPPPSYIVFGKGSAFPREIELSSITAATGLRLTDALVTLVFAGDVNGDGFDDFIVGHSGSGGYYRGSYTPASAAIHLGPNGSGVIGTGGTWGWSAAGDVNGDGFDDVISPKSFTVGDRYSGSKVFAGASVTLGGSGGTRAINAFDLATGIASDGIGYPATGVGDINGDGFDDLLIGSPHLGAGGAVRIVFGFGEVVPVISPDGKRASFRDVDGDLVNVRVSEGTLEADNIMLFPTRGRSGGAQFLALDLDEPEFRGANVRITARPTAAGGDGRVNVGYIDAGGVDLGRVIIDGDLGGLAAGDSNLTTPGLTSLRALSLGLLGGATSPGNTQLSGELALTVAGGVGSLRVKTDLSVHSIHVTGDMEEFVVGGNIRTNAYLSITGDLATARIGNDLSGVNFRIGGRLGELVVGGDIENSRIAIGGRVLPANEAEALALGELRVRGSVSHSQILAGYDDGGNRFGALNADVRVGLVKVGGNWVSSTLVAGIRSSLADFGGASDEVVPGGNAITSRVESLTIRGRASGIVTAEEIGSVSVGGLRVPLSAGADSLAIGLTAPLRVREIAAPPFVPVTGIESSRGFTVFGHSTLEPLSYRGAGAGDVNGDGYGDVIIGTTHGANVLFGKGSGIPAANYLPLSAPDGFRVTGTPDIYYRVGAAGDVNGDGIGDFVLAGRLYAPSGSPPPGIGAVIFGTRNGFPAVLDFATLDGTNGFRLEGLGDLGYAGSGVASAGDVNGDGFDDILVASDTSIYVIFGRGAGFPASLPLSAINGTNGFRIDRAPGTNSRGPALSVAGDVNRDGFDDILIGDADAGASYVIFGKTTAFPAALALSSLDGSNGFTIRDSSTLQTGGSVSDAGDVNGDGFDDLLIGAAAYVTSSAAYVVFGRSAFAPEIELDRLGAAEGFRIGMSSGYGVGRSVAGGGDINGDGFDDVVVTAEVFDYRPWGVVFVVYGQPAFDSTIDLDTLGVRDGFRLDGYAPYSVRVDVAGDVNGDGNAELLTAESGVAVIFGASFPKAHISDDGRRATFLDPDGDLVTVRVSAGTLDSNDVLLVPAGHGVPGSRTFVELRLDDPASQGADIRITAEPTALGGDGHVDIGWIDASGIDLGRVTVRGNLGGIDAGDANLATPGLARLSAESFGASTASEIAGDLGALRVKTIAFAAVLHVDGDIGSLSIGGDARLDVAATGRIGQVTILGDLLDSTLSAETFGNIHVRGDLLSSQLLARGRPAPLSEPAALAIGQLRVNGSVEHSTILAGHDRDGPANPDVQIGAIKVGGDWIASSAAAGVRDLLGDGFGNGNDTLIPGGGPIISRIASIVIGGQALGAIPPGATPPFAFTAERIDRLKIGSAFLPLTPGADDLPIGLTTGLRVREVA